MTPYIFTGLPAKQQYYSVHGIVKTDINEIVEAVSEVCEVPVHDIFGPARKAEPTEARSIAIGLITISNPELTLKQLGKIFNNRHHATIIYARECYNTFLRNDKNYRHKVEKVKKNCMWEYPF